MKKKVIFIIILALIVIIGSFWFWQETKNNNVKTENLEEMNKNFPKKNSDCSDLFILGDGYAYYGEYVYYECGVISGADAGFFENMGDGFARDNKNIFYQGKILDGADVTTFKKVDKWLNVFVDKNSGYYLGDVITLQDVDDLVNFLSHDVGGKDLGNNYRLYRGRVYYWIDGGGQAAPGMALVGANPDTFVILDNNYCKWDKVKHKFDPCRRFGKDSSTVYYQSHKMKDADSKTFQILKYSYSKDDGSVFYDIKKIEGADSKTFQIISERYSKDKNGVYFQNYKILYADPDTFSIVSEEKGLSKDKANYYSGNKIANGL